MCGKGTFLQIQSQIINSEFYFADIQKKVCLLASYQCHVGVHTLVHTCTNKHAVLTNQIV